jgi:hypothetical protein
MGPKKDEQKIKTKDANTHWHGLGSACFWRQLSSTAVCNRRGLFVPLAISVRPPTI